MPISATLKNILGRPPTDTAIGQSTFVLWKLTPHQHSLSALELGVSLMMLDNTLHLSSGGEPNLRVLFTQRIQWDFYSPSFCQHGVVAHVLFGLVLSIIGFHA